MEEYRSGHNEAVLKTVWVKAHGGSNPSSSATKNPTNFVGFFVASEEEFLRNLRLRAALPPNPLPRGWRFAYVSKLTLSAIKRILFLSLRSVWIPFLFLCRQAVELSLKNALKLTNIEIKRPTHNTKELWDVFVKKNKTYIFEGEQCFIKRISVLVEVLV